MIVELHRLCGGTWSFSHDTQREKNWWKIPSINLIALSYNVTITSNCIRRNSKNQFNSNERWLVTKKLWFFFLFFFPFLLLFSFFQSHYESSIWLVIKSWVKLSTCVHILCSQIKCFRSETLQINWIRFDFVQFLNWSVQCSSFTSIYNHHPIAWLTKFTIANAIT